MPTQENNFEPVSNSKMKCPVCGVALTMSERQNVEIDYCPECRGVWLDRGELDKIIERSIQVQDQTPQDAGRDSRADAHRAGKHSGGDHGYGDGDRGRGYQRKSWLREIFD